MDKRVIYLLSALVVVAAIGVACTASCSAACCRKGCARGGIRDQRKPVVGSPAVSCSRRQWRTAIMSGVFSVGIRPPPVRSFGQRSRDSTIWLNIAGNEFATRRPFLAVFICLLLSRN